MEQNAKTKAIRNHLILQQILKNVETPDLLKCRLVTSTNWYDLATKILSRRKDLRISFTHLDGEQLMDDGEQSDGDHDNVTMNYLKKPGFFSDATETPWPLSNLMEFFTKFARFPCHCRSFRFSEGFIEKNEEIKEFVRIYGRQVVDLEVDLLAKKHHLGNQVVETFGQMLVQMPNLESLTIAELSTSSRASARFFLPEMLKLTSLQIGPDVPYDLDFLGDLRSAAPNLKQSGFRKTFFRYSASEIAGYVNYRRKNVETYNLLNFCPREYNLAFFEKLARSRPRFRAISIDLKEVKTFSGPIDRQTRFNFRVTSVLTKFLKSSQNTLKSLKTMEQLELLPELKIPVLAGVKSIEIRIFNVFVWHQSYCSLTQNFECFPVKNIDFPTIFPCLESLDLVGPSWGCVTRVAAENLLTFDPANLQLNWTPTTTVKSLKIQADFSIFPPALIDQLGQTFLGVENLTLVYAENFQELAPQIAENFPRLTDFFTVILVDSLCCALPLVQTVIGMYDAEHRRRPLPEFSTNLMFNPETHPSLKVEIDSKRNPSYPYATELKTVKFECYSACDSFTSDCQLRLEDKLKTMLPDSLVTVLTWPADRDQNDEKGHQTLSCPCVSNLMHCRCKQK